MCSPELDLTLELALPNSFALTSPLHASRNPSRTIFDTGRCICESTSNRSSCTASCTLKCLANSSSQSSNDTTNRVRDTTDRVADSRCDELDAGSYTGFLLTDWHRDDLWRSAVRSCFRRLEGL